MGGEVLRALDGVSLSVPRGEWLAIMGPSGCGKSTLLNIIGCLDTPTSGRYRLNGQAVDGLDDGALAAVRNRSIGYVFQNFNLLPRTPALRQVMLPLQYRHGGQMISGAEQEARARAALDWVGLADRADHVPSELSGGQRQRVAIARALVNEPTILVADEPTGNLDSRSGADILRLFESLYKDRQMTILVVTHDEEIAAHAGRTIRMRDGRIVHEEK
ncbi:MAG: ABC transporter ATP-binding protein [Ardenticatenales bacterium]